MLIELFGRPPNDNAPEIHAPEIVRFLCTLHTDIAVAWIGARKYDVLLVESFKRPEVVRREDKLAPASLRKDREQLSEQIFKYAGIKLIDCHGDRWLVVHENQDL